ncbi:hypothetical protein D082_24800 [Synechocystis sp. PCC 6714]|nr:hypothetical protein D082_24800 [Synechocystis sp. PCC 6714]
MEQLVAEINLDFCLDKLRELMFWDLLFFVAVIQRKFEFHCLDFL